MTKSYRKPKSEKDLTARLREYTCKRDERIENTSLLIKRLRRIMG